MDPKKLASEVARLRSQWLLIIRNLGIEALAPAEERKRIDRLETAIGGVFMLAAQVRMADLLGIRREFLRIAQQATEEEGESDEEP